MKQSLAILMGLASQQWSIAQAEFQCSNFEYCDSNGGCVGKKLQFCDCVEIHCFEGGCHDTTIDILGGNAVLICETDNACNGLQINQNFQYKVEIECHGGHDSCGYINVNTVYDECPQQTYPQPTYQDPSYPQPTYSQPTYYDPGYQPPTSLFKPTIKPSYPSGNPASYPTYGDLYDEPYDPPADCVRLDCEEGNCQNVLFQGCDCIDLRCLGTNTCTNSTVLCANPDGCYIHCSGYGACTDLDVFMDDPDTPYGMEYDPYSGNTGRLNLLCDDEESCEGLTVCDVPQEVAPIQCPVQEYCYNVDCTTGECANQILQACDGVCHKYHCYGKEACANTTLYCNADHPEGCQVDCRGQDACFGLTLYQFGHNSQVHLYCDAESCEGAQWADLDASAPQFNAYGCPVVRESTWYVQAPPQMHNYQSIAIITGVETSEAPTKKPTEQEVQPTERPVTTTVAAQPTVAQTTQSSSAAVNEGSSSGSSSGGSDGVSIAIFAIAGVSALAILGFLAYKGVKRHQKNQVSQASSVQSSVPETNRSSMSYL